MFWQNSNWHLANDDFVRYVTMEDCSLFPCVVLLAKNPMEMTTKDAPLFAQGIACQPLQTWKTFLRRRKQKICQCGGKEGLRNNSCEPITSIFQAFCVLDWYVEFTAKCIKQRKRAIRQRPRWIKKRPRSIKKRPRWIK